MSITKFSPQDINRLAERLNRLENEIKALKMEKKAHYTAIKDGAFRILDNSGNEVVRIGKSDSEYGFWLKGTSGNILFKSTGTITELINALIQNGVLSVKDGSGNERVKLGKISAGVYGIKIYDANGNVVQEITDSAVNAIKIVGAGIDEDGAIIMPSLVVPDGRKVIFQYAFDSLRRDWDGNYLNQGECSNLGPTSEGDVLTWLIIGINNGTWHDYELSWTNGSRRTYQTKSIFTAGAYSNLKFYCRIEQATSTQRRSAPFWGFWIAYEVAA